MQWRICAAILLALLPILGAAQTGRGFVSVEAYIGLGRVVHVGKIKSLVQTEHDGPLNRVEKFGDPYRLVFSVEETIKGEPTEEFEIILSLQSTHFLDYMRDNDAEIMLVGGPNRLDTYASASVGIEEEGRRVEGNWYQFRLLKRLPLPDEEPDRAYAEQINQNYDECLMFTNELKIVKGRKAILERAREAARLYSKTLASVQLLVPNEFGRLVADPNAFCMIMLPVSEETERTLINLLQEPGTVLSRIERNGSRYWYWMQEQALLALKPFPSEENAAIVRRFAAGYDPDLVDGMHRYSSLEDVQRTAWRLLQSWKL